MSFIDKFNGLIMKDFVDIDEVISHLVKKKLYSYNIFKNIGF